MDTKTEPNQRLKSPKQIGVHVNFEFTDIFVNYDVIVCSNFTANNCVNTLYFSSFLPLFIEGSGCTSKSKCRGGSYGFSFPFPEKYLISPSTIQTDIWVKRSH